MEKNKAKTGLTLFSGHFWFLHIDTQQFCTKYARADIPVKAGNVPLKSVTNVKQINSTIIERNISSHISEIVGLIISAFDLWPLICDWPMR